MSRIEILKDENEIGKIKKFSKPADPSMNLGIEESKKSRENHTPVYTIIQL